MEAGKSGKSKQKKLKYSRTRRGGVKHRCRNNVALSILGNNVAGLQKKGRQFTVNSRVI